MLYGFCRSRKAHGGGRVVGNEKDPAIPAPEDTVVVTDPERTVQQGADRGAAAEHGHLRIDEFDLWPEPGIDTGLQFSPVRGAVAGRTTLDTTGQKEILTAEPMRCKQSVQEFAGRADKGASGPVFPGAGRLADQDDPRIRRPLAGNGMEPVPEQAALPASPDRSCQFPQSCLVLTAGIGVLSPVHGPFPVRAADLPGAMVFRAPVFFANPMKIGKREKIKWKNRRISFIDRPGAPVSRLLSLQYHPSRSVGGAGILPASAAVASPRKFLWKRY